MPDADDFVWAYDTRTGEKLPHKVPRAHLRIYPHLSETPTQKAKAGRRSAPSDTETPED